MPSGDITFIPNLYVTFNYSEKSGSVRYTTYISIDKVYEISNFENVCIGRVVNIDFNEMIITVDCSSEYATVVRKFDLDCIEYMFECDSEKKRIKYFG